MHGWCINKGYWSNQVAYFNKKYRVITFDMPGFGKSGKNRTDWSTKAYGTDVNSVISQLNLKNVILIGHSMAGDIVLQAGTGHFPMIEAPAAFNLLLEKVIQNIKMTSIKY